MKHLRQAQCVRPAQQQLYLLEDALRRRQWRRATWHHFGAAASMARAFCGALTLLLVLVLVIAFVRAVTPCRCLFGAADPKPLSSFEVAPPPRAPLNLFSRDPSGGSLP